jgi:hypothetical protein
MSPQHLELSNSLLNLNPVVYGGPTSRIADKMTLWALLLLPLVHLYFAGVSGVQGVTPPSAPSVPVIISGNNIGNNNTGNGNGNNDGNINMVGFLVFTEFQLLR